MGAAPEGFVEACKRSISSLFDPSRSQAENEERAAYFGKALRRNLLIYLRCPESTEETRRGIGLRFVELAMVIVEEERGGCGYEGTKGERAVELERLRIFLERLCAGDATYWWNYHLVEARFDEILETVRFLWVV